MSLQVKVWFQNRRTKQKKDTTKDSDKRSSSTNESLATCNILRLLEQGRLLSGPAPPPNSLLGPPPHPAHNGGSLLSSPGGGSSTAPGSTTGSPRSTTGSPADRGPRASARRHAAPTRRMSAGEADAPGCTRRGAEVHRIKTCALSLCAAHINMISHFYRQISVTFRIHAKLQETL